MDSILTGAAVILPILGAIYIVYRIEARGLSGWQNFASLTVLILAASLLLLVASGKVTGLDTSGKVEFVRGTAAEIKSLAKTMAELMALQQDPIIESEQITLNRVREFRKKAEELLILAEVPEGERKPIIDALDKRVKRWQDHAAERRLPPE